MAFIRSSLVDFTRFPCASFLIFAHGLSLLKSTPCIQKIHLGNKLRSKPSLTKFSIVGSTWFSCLRFELNITTPPCSQTYLMNSKAPANRFETLSFTNASQSFGL